ncbi:MAG: hypothetical protein E7415_05965 [Ruminococcaceae bacterium]|nr:hypothetical protein [Oscillospiraceae bacterium]
MAYSSNDLFKYQQLYENEKKRLEAAQRSESAEKIRQNYEEKIQAAKDDIKIEKLKNEEILKLQKLSNKDYLAALKALADQEKDIIKALKNEVTEIYKDISDAAENSIEEVLKKQQKFEDKLSNHKNSKFLHYNVYGGGVNGGLLSYDMLNDYSKTNQELMDYYNSIIAVKERIKNSGFDSYVTSDFLSVLSDMSVEQGTKFSDILLNSSDNKFINAINGYLQNQMLTKKISSELFASDFENAVSDTASYMKAELSRLGFEIPENFTVSGTISADNFGVAFVNKLDDYLENIRNMISQFNASLSAPSFVFESRGGVSNASSGITYNQSFNIGSSKESTYEQITAWKNATMQAKLRGQ